MDQYVAIIINMKNHIVAFKENFKALLNHLGFEEKSDLYTKPFEGNYYLGVDF